MAFPKRGFWTPSDAISRAMWGMQNNETISSCATTSLAASPDTSHPRGNLLRFLVSAGSSTANAYTSFDINYIPHNVVAGTATANHTLTAGFVRLSFAVGTPTNPATSGTMRILGGFNSAKVAQSAGSEAWAIETTAVSSSQFRLLFKSPVLSENLGGTRSITYDSVTDLRLRFERSGTFSVDTKLSGETTWTAESAIAATSFSGVQSFRLGVYSLSAVSGNNSIYVDDFAVSDIDFDDIDRHWYLAGSGCRDLNQSAAALAIVYPDNLFRDVTQAQVRYSTSPSLSNAVTTSFTTLAALSNHTQGIVITGLVSNTGYYYRFDFADAGGSVVYSSSDIYRLHTHPEAGSNQRYQFAVASCHVQTPPHHPYEEEQHIIDQIPLDNAVYLGYIHLGDQGYEGNLQIEAEDDYFTGAGNPPESAAEYEQKLREWYSDLVLFKFFTRGMVLCIPDDHESINQSDATIKPGGSNENVLANNWPGSHTTDYQAATTVGDLYNAGIPVFEDLFTNHWLDKTASATDGVLYQAKIVGASKWLFINGRYERNEVVTPDIFMSTAQLNWAKSEIADFGNASGLNSLIIFSNAGLAAITAQTVEGWQTVAIAQYRDFIDHVYSAVGSGKNVFYVSGDDHVGHAAHKDISTTANPAMIAPWRGEVKASGASSNFFDNSAGYAGTGSANILWKFSPTLIQDVGATVIRSSGVHFLVNKESDGVTLRNWAGGDYESDFTLFGSTMSTFPTEWQRKAPIVIQSSQVSGTGGSHSNFPVLITADNLPSDLIDSDGPAPAQSDGGDIRFTSDEAGTTLLNLEVVSFTQNTNPASATAELWVKIPSLSQDSDTTIYVWWSTQNTDTQPAAGDTGGRDGVWTDYLAVYHGDSLTDSTGNSRDLSAQGSASFGVTGKIGNAYTLDGNGDMFQVNGFFPVLGTGARSFSVWANRSGGNISAIQQVVFSYGVSAGVAGGKSWNIAWNPTTNHFRTETGGGFEASSAILATTGTWQYIAQTYSSGGANITAVSHYVNGAFDTATAQAAGTVSTSNVAPFTFGGRPQDGGGTTNHFNGSLDEFRARASQLSANWIATEYNNQNSPSTFAVEGGAQALKSLTTGILRFIGGSPDAVQPRTKSPSTGVLSFLGTVPDVIAATGLVKTKSPSVGVMSFLGGAPDAQSVIVKTKSPGVGVISFLGGAPGANSVIELTKSPSVGVLSFIGGVPAVTGGSALVTKTPSTGVLSFIGGTMDARAQFWSALPTGSSLWSLGGQSTASWSLIRGNI